MMCLVGRNIYREGRKGGEREARREENGRQKDKESGEREKEEGARGGSMRGKKEKLRGEREEGQRKEGVVGYRLRVCAVMERSSIGVSARKTPEVTYTLGPDNTKVLD